MKQQIKEVLRPFYRRYRLYVPKTRNIQRAVRRGIYRNAVNTAINDRSIDEAYNELSLFVQNAWEERFMLEVLSRIKYSDEYKKQIDSYVKFTKNKKSRKVIFTAISGGYDSYKPPAVLNPDYDYVVFTDTPVPSYGFLIVKPFSYSNADPTRTSRFVKTHAHDLLGEYEIAVWVDASIMLTDDIDPIVDKLTSSKKSIGAIPHPLRQTIYEEYRACAKLGKDDSGLMKKQVEDYRASGVEEQRLIESGFMIFDLTRTKTKYFLDSWWAEIDKYSKRDQIALSHALSLTNTEWFALTNPPHSVRNHPSFILTTHQPTSTGGVLDVLAERITKKNTNPYSDVTYSEIRDSRISEVRKNKPKIDVVLCVHNAKEAVEKCLESIEKHRKSDSLSLIIIDDGSDKPTANLLKNFAKEKDWARVVRNEKASGYSKAASLGMKESTGEMVILLNSDTVVTDSWAEKMYDALLQNPGTGIVGPMSNAASVQSLPDFRSKNQQTAVNDLPIGYSVDDMNKKCEEWSYANILPIVPLVHGFCYGIKREVLDSIGYFDHKAFPRGYGEENDFSIRATNAGFTQVIATHTYVYHQKSMSFQSDERKKLMDAGAKALREKHTARRVDNAVKSMVEHPLLERMRHLSQKIY